MSGKELATLESFLNENKSLGMENVGADDKLTPYLKFIQGGTKDKDSDGRRYPEGKILYTGTGEVFDTVDLVFLRYVKIETPSIDDKTIMNKQYKIAGVLGEKKLPFILYAGGSAIGSFKKYVTEASKMGRPFFSLRVQVKTSGQSNEKGEWFIPVYTISPINDLAELQVLKQLAEQFESVLNTSDVYETPGDEGAKVKPGEKLTEDVDAPEFLK